MQFSFCSAKGYSTQEAVALDSAGPWEISSPPPFSISIIISRVCASGSQSGVARAPQVLQHRHRCCGQVKVHAGLGHAHAPPALQFSDEPKAGRRATFVLQPSLHTPTYVHSSRKQKYVGQLQLPMRLCFQEPLCRFGAGRAVAAAGTWKLALGLLNNPSAG